MQLRQRWMLAGEVVRFMTVGTLAAVNNTLIIVILTEIAGLHYLVSYVVCFMIVTAFAFLLNRTWTFRIDHATKRGEWFRYFGFSFMMLMVAMGLTFIIVSFGLPYYAATLIAAAVVVPINFVLHRFGSFRIGRCFA